MPSSPCPGVPMTHPLRVAINDLWGHIRKQEIDQLQPETIRVAMASHQICDHGAADDLLGDDDGNLPDHTPLTRPRLAAAPRLASDPVAREPMT